MGSECSNINNRQLYIDWLKGFCILLVIMGHVIAWMYSDFDVLLKASSDGFNLLWKLIYSFHMPLFMFCSGIFIVKPKGWYCLKNVSTVLNKRFCSLVIPFFCMGGGSILSFQTLVWLLVFNVFIWIFCNYLCLVLHHIKASYVK